MHSYPTTFRGARYRSRLEARWAAFFTLLGWEFEYEPFDLDSYIPDFVLNFDQPIVVEVKPAMSLAECQQHLQRVERSGWTKEAIVVGASWKVGAGWGAEYPALGLLAERSGLDWFWSEAHWTKCRTCERLSFYHMDGSFACRRCGAHEGKHHLGPVIREPLSLLWNEASSEVQWKGDRRD